MSPTLQNCQILTGPNKIRPALPINNSSSKKFWRLCPVVVGWLTTTTIQRRGRSIDEGDAPYSTRLVLPHTPTHHRRKSKFNSAIPQLLCGLALFYFYNCLFLPRYLRNYWEGKLIEDLITNLAPLTKKDEREETIKILAAFYKQFAQEICPYIFHMRNLKFLQRHFADFVNLI